MESLLPPLNIRLERIDSLYLNSSWHDRDYRDEFTRFYYILGGQGQIRHSGGEFELLPGYIYLIPEYIRHDYSHRGNMRLFYFHCQVRTGAGLSLFDHYHCDFVRSAREIGVGFQDFERLKVLGKRKDTAALMEITSRIMGLLVYFIGDSKEWDRREEDKKLARLMGVLNHVKENLRRDVPVTELASLVNMERSAFSRFFKESMGLSPGRYVQKKRIEAARHLLTRTGASCEEAAEELGFFDASHFSRIFKRETGIRPGEYCRRVRRGDGEFR